MWDFILKILLLSGLRMGRGPDGQRRPKYAKKMAWFVLQGKNNLLSVGAWPIPPGRRTGTP